MKINYKIILLGAVCFCHQSIFAIDWLKLQGTEEKGTAARAKVWGFIQASYEKDYSKPYKNPLDFGTVHTAASPGELINVGNTKAYVPAGGTVYTPPSPTYIAPMMVGPDLKTQESFTLNRARIGVRGTPLPIDDKINYFFMAEFGDNLITNNANKSAKITDGSVTFNHIPGARVRAGLFKTPGSEEGLQGIATFNYVEFSQVTNQLLLERLPNPHYTPNNSYANSAALGVNPTPGPTTEFGTVSNAFIATAAFRDTGIQIFDTFKMGKNLELSYAAMIGNGNGLNMNDTDKAKDKYGYIALEWVTGGSGIKREGIKLFGWTQNGKRLLDTTDNNIDDPRQHGRIRKGAGLAVRTKSYRLTTEYMWGRGMIFVGPDKPTFDQNGETRLSNKSQLLYTGGDGADGEADGWYAELGYFVKKIKGLEIDFRYDVYNRLKHDPGPDVPCDVGGVVFQSGVCTTPRSFYSIWKTGTLGVQYHLNPKNRITFNVSARSVHSPEWKQMLVITDANPLQGAKETNTAYLTRLKNSPNLFGVNPEKGMSRLDKRMSLQITSIF